MSTGGMMCAGVLVLGALLPGAKADELFENGGFEAGVSGWRTLNMSGHCKFATDKKVKHDGKKSLRIEKSASGRPDFLKQSAELASADGVVRMRIAYRVSEKSRLEVTAYFFNAAGDTIGKGQVPVVHSGETKGFEVAEKELDVPKGATGFGVNAMIREPCVVWLDDISVEHVPASATKKGKKRGKSAEAAAPKPFVLANGGFDGDLTGWRASSYGSGRLEASVDKRNKAKGKGALRLERESPRLFPPDGMCTTVPTAGRGKRASLSFSVKADDAARPAVCLQALDEHGCALATARVEPAPTLEFERHQLLVELPEGTVHVAIVLMVAGRGNAWFDEVSVKKK